MKKCKGLPIINILCTGDKPRIKGSRWCKECDDDRREHVTKQLNKAFNIMFKEVKNGR